MIMTTMKIAAALAEVSKLVETNPDLNVSAVPVDRVVNRHLSLRLSATDHLSLRAARAAFPGEWSLSLDFQADDRHYFVWRPEDFHGFQVTITTLEDDRTIAAVTS